MHIRVGIFQRYPYAVLAAALTVTATAGAATVHRLTISQTSGSGGAQTFLQSSASNSALQGEVGGTSPNVGIKIPFGTLGEYDPSGSTFGIGLLGVSATGYAVAGESLANQPSVLGYAGGTGDGVDGIQKSTNLPSNEYPAAVRGEATGIADGGDFFADNGGFGTTGVSDYISPSSQTFVGGIGILGLPSGVGVQAEGYSGNSSAPALTAYDLAGGSDLIGAFGCAPSGEYNVCTNPESFIVQSSSANRSGQTSSSYAGAADTQISGDLYVYGNVYQDCASFPATTTTDCYNLGTGTFGTSGVTRSAGGNDVKVYNAAQSVRTVEDFGQARLVNGRAYVNLDPAFARTTEPNAPYLVFVTPSGESHSLYVTKRSIAGFEVHESEGGRSNMSIDYRIVAKPLGDSSQRFVAVAPKHRIPGYNMQTNSMARHRKASSLRHPMREPISPLTLAH